MDSVERWVHGPLRKAATGGAWTVTDALRGVSLRLQMHAAEHGDEDSFIAVWIKAIESQVKCIQAAPEGAQHNRKMIAKDDPTIRDALTFMVKKYGDEDAKELLAYNGDAELRYSGDAAQRLLMLLADRAENPQNRAAQRWIAQQECGRHAFARKQEDGTPRRSPNDDDLSRKLRSKDEKLADKYGEYIAERCRLLEKETGVVNEGDFEYTDEEQARADALWRSAERRKGRSAAAIRKDLSITRAAWDRLRIANENEGCELTEADWNLIEAVRIEWENRYSSVHTTQSVTS